MQHETPHAIIDLAQVFLDPAKDGKGFVFLESGKKPLERALEKLADKPDLRHAVMTLVSLAKFLDDRGNRASAQTLVQVASTSFAALKAQGEASSKLVEQIETVTTQVFAAFSAKEMTHAAPAVRSSKYGMKAAPGTIGVGSLRALGKQRA